MDGLIEWMSQRVSLMKQTPAIVAICEKTPNRTVIVRWDADLRQWASHAENSEGYAMLGSHKVWRNDEEMIAYMIWHGGIGDWQMRQQTNNGRFDTILTQHWNEVGDEQNP